MSKAAKNKTKKVLPAKQGQQLESFLKPAIGVALAFVAYRFLAGLGSGIRRVNVADEGELREVFFGEAKTGKFYAVLCQSEDSTAPISSVFHDAFKDGSVKADFRVIDCDHVLPASGKTVAERFGLDLKQRPTIFLSGATGAPTQVHDKHLKTGAMLARYLRGRIEVRAAKIETTGDLKTRCLDKDVCGLLLKGSKKPPSFVKDAMSKLMKDFPNVAFASVDSSVLYVLNLEEYIPELEAGRPRFVVFKKVSGSLEPGDSRLITSVAHPNNNNNNHSLSYVLMKSLVAGVLENTQAMQKLPSLPVVKTRTKKLEEQERAKRQRRTEQQNRRQGSTDSSASASGLPPVENDGSRDGRRAERERRRQEHREKNNVREKTPEEIAEMERRRRERMAEEAAKWNIAPEDAPEEGDPIDEDDLTNIMDDSELDEEDAVHEDESSDEDDDEDVIDLD